MQINEPEKYQTATELEIIQQHLPIQDKLLLELGCGRAWMTRQLAERFQPRQIIATEVDTIQHGKNLLIDDLPNVTFTAGGAEAIDLEDSSVDVVIMLKSLHHVPLPLMGLALSEIARVLRPGGLAYISEPVYAGDFNEILRLFNDEKQVREAAFAAVQNSVAKNELLLVRQIFFNAPGSYRDFAEFDERMIQVTHTNHQIDEALYRRIRNAFNRHMGEDGAHFLKPSRVDLLQKPGS
ncbi:class I SAM-dependent methyltransferase [Sedimenticola sp.]|uniref:class I SAM-dependent methyltransferase n=1 Tax=Sedimenticola sp. TaxID=1940285 RepID=UPI002585B4BA|nr:class I SAM-dependent methyltransferase [Sedimenticola sp.]MCW8904604.1 class I SAM-dependent methyltransferase [Sedimenticola sp.]